MMKFKNLIYLFIALVVISSCEFEKMNTSTTGVSDAELKKGGLVYGGAIMKMQQSVIPIGSPAQTTGPGNDLQATDLISSGSYIGYFGNNNNWNSGIEASWNFVDNRTGYIFEILYSKMFQAWSEVARLLKEAENPEDKEVAAVFDVVRNLGWLRAADTFGPIVYTKAGSGDISPMPDPLDVVYKEMLANLAEDVEVLNKAASLIMPKYDFIYNGDPIKWAKLANSLMLRIAVRTHFVNEALAKEYITKAMSYPLIETVADEAKVGNNSKMPLLNPMMASIGYGETKMGATMWSYMTGFKDTRIAKLFNETVPRSGVAKGYYPIAPTNNMPKGPGDNASNLNVTNDSPMYWFRASETYFLKAEAALYGFISDDVKSLYETGVRRSFEEMGVAADADAYLNNTGAPADLNASNYYFGSYICSIAADNITPKWDEAASPEKKLQRIMTQKYLALYPNAIEAWTEYRRTGYPYLMRPADKGAYARIGSDNPDILTPERIQYSANFYNPAVTQASVEAILGGPDKGATRLWWVRKDRPEQPK